MKIIFFGDSLTEGSYGGSYVEAIRERHPGHEIINAGVGGDTVVNLAERLDDAVIDQAPDGVFVMVGGNDAVSWSQPRTRIYYEQAKGVPAGMVTSEMFRQHYRDVLERLHLNFIQTWVGLPPAEYNPAVVETQRQYNRLAAEVARATNTPALDLMPHFAPEVVPERSPIDIGFIQVIGQRTSSGWDDFDTAQKEGGYTYTFDGLHLTPTAAQKMATLIADFIEF
jgi:lysophospholipase L1-like esterase